MLVNRDRFNHPALVAVFVFLSEKEMCIRDRIKGIGNEEFTSESQWVYWFFLIGNEYSVDSKQETRGVWGLYSAGVQWRYYGTQRYVGGFGIVPAGAEGHLSHCG